MKFVLTIHCDNDIFKPDPIPEVARILNNVTMRISDGERIDTYRNLHDANGNIVGQFKMIREDNDRR